MPLDPNDIYHNGYYYSRNGGGGPVSSIVDPVTGRIKATAGGIDITAAVSLDLCPDVVLWGDSGVMYESRWDAAASTGVMTQTGGVATANFAAHGAYVGCKVWVVNCSDAGWYGERTITAIIDANNFQFAVSPTANADAYNARESGTQPSVIYANRDARDNAFVRALAIAGPRARIVANLGGNSQSAASMLTHLTADLAAYPNSSLWVCSTLGANDVRVSSPGSLKDSISYAKQALRQIRDAGKKVLYLGWQSNNTNDATKNKTNFKLEDGVAVEAGTNGVNRAAQRFNKIMKKWCAENKIAMISKFDVLSDPTSATAYSRTNTMRADGVHEGKRGGWLIAKKIAPWLSETFPTLNDPLPVSLIDRRYDTAGALVDATCDQIFRNPMLATVSGTSGLGFDVNLTSAFGMPAVSAGFSLVQRTEATDGDDYGFNQVASWSTSGAGSDQGGGIKFVAYPADIPAGTNRMQSGCKVRTSAQTAFTGLRLVMDVTTSNYGLITAESKTFGSGTADNVSFGDTELIVNEWIMSPVLTLPSDAIVTALYFYVQGFTSTFPGGFTIAAGRPMLRCWTD